MGVLGKLQKASPEFAKLLYGAEALGLTIDPKTGRRIKREEMVDEFGRSLHEDVGLRDLDAEAADYALINSMVRDKKFGQHDPNNPIKGTAFENLLASKELNQLMVALQDAQTAQAKGGGKSVSRRPRETKLGAASVPGVDGLASARQEQSGEKTRMQKQVKISDDQNPQTTSLQVIEEQSWIGTWTYGPADRQQEYSIHPNPMGGLTFKTLMRGVDLAC